MKILVTGGTGFIGRHLVAKLSARGDEIFCLVRETSNKDILAPFKVGFIYGDISAPKSIMAIDHEIDIIVHCAAYVNNDDKEKLHSVNVMGTENVCKLALSLGVKKMLYLSSVAVVSGNSELPLTEEMPYKATNLYGESKIEAEKIVLSFRKKGLRAIIIRPCMIYGPDEPHLLKTLLRMIYYRLIPIINGGGNKFHLGYVENLIDLMLFSLDDDRFLEGSFFAADKEVLSMGEVIRLMARAIKAKEPYSLPMWVSNLLFNLPVLRKKVGLKLKDREYSLDRIEDLGFRFSYTAEQGIARSCAELFGNRKKGENFLDRLL